MNLEQRIERLERTNVRLKIGIVMLASLVGLGVFAGAANMQSVPNQIVSHEFLLTDAANQIKWRLLVENGRPSMNFVDTNGDSRVFLDDQGLTLFGPKRKLLGQLLQQSPGNPKPDIAYLSLYADKSKAFLGVVSGNPAQLELRDTTGQVFFHQP